MDAGSLRVLTQLVDKLTDKRNHDWDPDALRRLKLVCKKSGDPAITAVFGMLMERVKDQHARARLHAVNLANELFTRSSLFRTLIARSFTAFLEYSLGYKSARPLPPPQQDAVQLRERALECIERWVEHNGTAHPQIRMGHRYLKEVVKMQFPELQARAAAAEAEAAAREERSRRLNAERYAVIREEYASTLADIDLALEEMEASFRLLEDRPEPLAGVANDDDWEDVADSPDEDDDEDAARDQLSASAAHMQQEARPVLRNADPAVMDSLRGNYRLLTHRHLPAVLEWLRVIVKVDVGSPGSIEHARKERMLRAAIKARDSIVRAKLHCETLMDELRGQRTSDASGSEAPLVIQASSGKELRPSQNALADGPHRSAAQAAVLRQRGSAPHQSTRGSRSESHATTAKAAIMAEVFGSDSDEEPPEAGHLGRQPHRATRRQQTAPRSDPPADNPSQPSSPPQILDPTYRKPPASPAAGQPAAKPAATVRPQEAEQISKSKLPEDVKKKLLAEAPTIPAGTHLAYWDSDKASLLSNKGMEVYNHWGAVDAHVEMPDNVISQFFSTRASYYDPATAKGPRQPEKEGEPDAEEEESPKKRPAPVTVVGLGAAATNSLGYPTLEVPHFPRLSSQKTAASLRSGDVPHGKLAAACGSSGSKATSGEPQNGAKSAAAAATADLSERSAAERDLPDRTAAAPLLPPGRDASGEAASGEARTKSAAARGQSQKPGRQAAGRAGRGDRTGRRRAPGRGSSAGRDAERVSASQRALDRAHNEAILGAAGATDEELAQQLAAHDFQAMSGAGSGGSRGKKQEREREPVRQRLAKKLLTGHATARAAEDLDAVEMEHIRDVESHRW